MDAALVFIRDYLKTEHAARRSVLLDKDEAKRLERLTALNAFYIEGARTEITSSGKRGGPEQKEEAANLKVRDLFLLKEFKGGELYAAIVSECERSAKTGYDEAVFVAKKKGGLMISGVANVCPTCAGSAKINGKPCPECKGDGVRTFVVGKKFALSSFGEPTAVKKLERPSHPRYQPDYDSYE